MAEKNTNVHDSWNDDDDDDDNNNNNNIAVVDLGHFLTRSSLTHPEVSAMVSPIPSAFWCVDF